MFPLDPWAYLFVMNIRFRCSFIAGMRVMENLICMIHSDFFVTGFIPVSGAKSYLGDDRIAGSVNPMDTMLD